MSGSCSFLLLLLALLHTAYGCQVSYVCDHNVTSLRDLYSGNFPPESLVCANLEPHSTEAVSYWDTSLSFSAVIRGDNSTVVCNNSGVDLGTSFSHSPLRFYDVDRVVLQGVTFEQCRRPLQFDRVKTVVISFTNLRNFTPGGALDIYNSPIICIENSSFANSTSMGYKNESFSGNAGGIAIGYSQPYSPTYMPEITIRGCSMNNNKAGASDEYRFTVLEVLSRRVYNQRGGGLAFYFGAVNYSGVVTIEDCQFNGNEAEDSGGGIYMFLGGMGSVHDITISDSIFTGNSALDGGGLEITHSNADSILTPNAVRVTNCMFDGNKGKFGGGYKNIQLDDQSNANHLLVSRTVFRNNKADVGAGIYLQAVVTVVKATLKRRVVMEDCTFVNNTGKRGVVFAIGNVVTVRGDTRLERSVGPALRVLGTLVILEGNILFQENRHHPEGFSGALYLSSFAQIILKNNTNIMFLNNNGSEGACIVVRRQLIAAAFTKQLYNPQCFMQYEPPTEPPHMWGVNITFEGNRATVGPAVLLSDATVCLWKNSVRPFFSSPSEFLETWPFLKMGTNYVNNMVTAPQNYVQTGISNLSLDTNVTTAYPGQMVRVEAVALDQFDQPTSGFIEITANQKENVSFEPSIVPISPLKDGIEFEYSGGEVDGDITTVVLNPFFISEQSNMNFTLKHSKCPAGYKLDGTTGKCQCEVTDVVIFCLDHGEGLLLAGGLWGASKCHQELAYYPCPPGYCNCINRNSSSEISEFDEGCQLRYGDSSDSSNTSDANDAICSSKRTGVLCGQCVPPNGVGLLTNYCRRHQGLPHFWLFPIYVIALVITLVLLVRLGVHLPTILRGFIFYIQIAPIAVAYFPDGFKPFTPLIACIGSTLALYLPYDFSFHEGMTALESHGLRYTTPLIALIVVPIAARAKHHRFKYWHGIWTIVLLLYVMSVETSTSLLFCPTLNVNDCPEVERVWFFDGSVQCYSGWHIPLAILAILCHLAQALLVLFVAAIIYYKTLRKKYAKFEQLERFSTVVTHGIKHEYKWWPIMELGCRYIFVTSVILSPGHVVVPLVLAIAAFVLQAMIHPYRSTIANYTESFLFLWLVCFLGLGNTTEIQNGKHDRWPDALLYIPVACALVVMVVHCVLLTRKMLLPYSDKVKRKLKMTSEDSVSKLRHRFTVSYSVRKRNLVQQESTITETIVGLDDTVEEAEEDEAAAIADSAGANTNGRLEIHTS